MVLPFGHPLGLQHHVRAHPPPPRAPAPAGERSSDEAGGVTVDGAVRDRAVLDGTVLDGAGPDRAVLDGAGC